MPDAPPHGKKELLGIHRAEGMQGKGKECKVKSKQTEKDLSILFHSMALQLHGVRNKRLQLAR